MGNLSNSVIQATTDQLTRMEDYRQFPYRCTENKLTIGIGRNIEEVGISRPEAEYLLNNDISESLSDLTHIFDPKQFLSFHPKIQQVLINMRFQLGPKRFRGFRETIKAAKAQDWSWMMREMADSKWCEHDTPARAKELIAMVRSTL